MVYSLSNLKVPLVIGWCLNACQDKGMTLWVLKVPLVIGWCLNACQDKGMTLWIKSELILNDIMIND